MVNIFGMVNRHSSRERRTSLLDRGSLPLVQGNQKNLAKVGLLLVGMRSRPNLELA